jgi:hypothetical protein
MKGGTFLLALCWACGNGPLTNNTLVGTWTTDLDLDYAVMELLPGPEGVHGKTLIFSFSNGPGASIGTMTVSTLPDLEIRWTAEDGGTQDYDVQIVGTCPGQTQSAPAQIQAIQLVDATKQHLHHFVRAGPPPSCAVGTGAP